MIGDRLAQAMNEQIRVELESYYIYLSMAAWLHDRDLDGMAQWMRSQAHEEMVHAMKFFDHILDRGSKVVLQDVKQIKTDWSSVQEIWSDTYEHEQFVTSKVNDLLTIAREERDYQAEPLLNWFIEEQIEEEATASKIAGEIEMVGNDTSSLLMLDRELGQRSFPTGSPLDPAAGKET
ncbi:MAG: ferritin [Desulfobacterales bacterium]